MEDEFPLSNAFADKGFLPQPYGTRSIVEYASRLIDVSPPGVPPVSPGEVIDVDNPKGNGNTNTPQEQVEQCMKALDNFPQGLKDVVEKQYLVSAAPESAGYANKYVRAPRENSNTENNDGNNGTGILRNIINFVVNKSTGGDQSHMWAEPANQALSWHWSDSRLACISSDGEQVSVYNTSDATWRTTNFTRDKVDGIRAVAWRPYAANTLAIACNIGVVIYSFSDDVNKYLTYPGHTACTRLTWNSDGTKLASASPEDFSVRLWDVASGTSVRVCTDGSVVSFSPNIPDLLVVGNALKPSFRFWSTDTWDGERWNFLSGVPTAAAWHPKSTHFALASREDSCVHFFKFVSHSSIASTNFSSSAKLVHSELTTLPKLGPGGIPRVLAWDPTGERFAVAYEHQQHQGAFEDYSVDPDRRFCVALYTTSTKPNFSIAPIGYITGNQQSGPPVDIQFKTRGGKSATSVLAVAWANGGVTFTQMFFQTM